MDINALADAALPDLYEQKIKALEAENAQLKQMLSGIAQAGSEGQLVGPNSYQFEENIARVQLAKLNEVSLTRELSLEEAKKCEIYSKILNGAKKNIKDVDSEVRNADTTKLLESLGSP
jgi:hypothetical protein